jgi:predicted amidophosphoribosyltransferase
MANLWNKCPKCGRTTQGREDFCPHCGEPLTIRCPECGNEWRYYLTHKFCPKCGAEIKK